MEPASERERARARERARDRARERESEREQGTEGGGAVGEEREACWHVSWLWKGRTRV